jgi:hypothetical protein
MPKHSKISKEVEEQIAEKIKSNPNIVLKDICEEFKISFRVLERIRRLYGVYSTGTKRLTEDEQNQILEFMRNNPLSTYDDIKLTFGATQNQLEKIRHRDKSLPNLMKITKRKKNNSYLSPEIENGIVVYMRDNINATHADITQLFNCSIRQIERLRKEYSFPYIKRRPATTHQSILRKEGKRYCPKCDTIKLLTDFNIYRLSCCVECEKERGNERIGCGDLQKFLTVKINQSLKRTHITNTLTLEDLLKLYNEQEGRCFYTNRPMVLAKNDIYSLSIDRVNSSKGYHLDNIHLCCSIINYMKQEYPLDLFLTLCKEVSTLHPSTS